MNARVPALALDPATIAGVSMAGTDPKFLQPKKVEQALMTLAALPPCDDSEADHDAPAHKRALALTEAEQQRLEAATTALSEALDALKAADQAEAQARADAGRVGALEAEASRAAAAAYLSGRAPPRPGLAEDLERARAACAALRELTQVAQQAREHAQRARGAAAGETAAILRCVLQRAGEVWAKSSAALADAVAHAEAVAGLLGDRLLSDALAVATGGIAVPTPPPSLLHARAARYQYGSAELHGTPMLLAADHPSYRLRQSAARSRLILQLKPSGAHLLVHIR